MESDFKLILSYIKEFYSHKKLIVLCVITSMVLGILTIVFTPAVYQGKTSFISNSDGSSKGGSGLKNIAALIGINVGANQSTKDIPVYLYPKLTGSVVYNKRLLEAEIVIPNKEKDTMTIREYVQNNNTASVGSIIKKYTIGLPGQIISLFKKKPTSSTSTSIENLEFLSREDRKLITYLQETVILTIDAGDGSLHISSTSNNPLVAAQIAQKAKEILQDLIIDYRIGKLEDSYHFIESQYAIKKKEYEEARAALAYYTDRNKFNNTSTSLLRKKDLESRSALAYSLFAELEKQRVNAQISLKEETPIFTTINPSVVPLEPSNSAGIITIIKYLIFGLFIAIVIYVFKIYYRILKTLWREV